MRANLVRASGLSLAQIVLATGLQLLLPPLLLSAWGDQGYALVVALQGFALYISIADAGMQAFLTQRFAVLVEEGRQEELERLARVALRAVVLLSVLGLFGVMAAFLVLGRPLYVTLAEAAGESPRSVLLAFALYVASGAFGLALGGWATAVDAARGRYARVQLFGLARTAIMSGLLAASAAFGASVPMALCVPAATVLLHDGLRFLHILSTTRRPASEGAPLSVRDVMTTSRGAMLQNVAHATYNGLQPVAAAMVLPAVLSVAVPGRMLSNGTRQLSIALQNAVWVAIARKLTALRELPDRHAWWAKRAPGLSLIQLFGVCGLAVVAPFVVPLWLPQKSDELLRLMPIYVAEQSLYAAVVPSACLLLSVGRFGWTGVGILGSAVVAVSVTVVTIPTYGAAGYALGALAGLLLVQLPVSLWLELRYWGGLRGAKRELLERLLFCGGAAASGIVLAKSYWAGVAVLLGACGLAAATFALRNRAE